MRTETMAVAALLGLSGCFSALPPETGSGDLAPTEAGTSGGVDSTGLTEDSTSGADDTVGDDGVSTTGEGGSDSASSGRTSEDTTTGGDTGRTDDASTGSGANTVCPVFFDTFDDGLEDLRWNQPYPGATNEADGESIITVTAATDDEFARMMVDPEMSGMEGATARFEIGTPPQTDGVLLILWVEPHAGAGRIAYNLAHHGTEILLEARITPEVGSPSIVAETPWNPDTMHWLQLREDAGTLYFEASADGTTFDVIFEMPTPFDVSDAFVGFVGHNVLALPGDVEVSVRSFELECG